LGTSTINMETANYKGIPAMSTPEVHQYLNELGRGWTGQGVAMEVGCWLGATSAALLDGLVEAGYDKLYWAFDKWRSNEAEVQKAYDQKVLLGISQDLLPIFLKNTKSIYPKVHAVQGIIPPILNMFNLTPIEICLFDAPKSNPVFSDSIHKLLPYFIPGVTVLGLLDYYFYLRRKEDQLKKDWEKFLVPVQFIEEHRDNFTVLRDFKENSSCVFFRYEKPISWKK